METRFLAGEVMRILVVLQLLCACAGCSGKSGPQGTDAAGDGTAMTDQVGTNDQVDATDKVVPPDRVVPPDQVVPPDSVPSEQRGGGEVADTLVPEIVDAVDATDTVEVVYPDLEEASEVGLQDLGELPPPPQCVLDADCADLEDPSFGFCKYPSGICLVDGTCEIVFAPVGKECDDGDSSTCNDSCDPDGSCFGIQTCPVPPDFSTCMTLACVEGTCQEAQAPDGTACAADGPCLAGVCNDGGTCVTKSCAELEGMPADVCLYYTGDCDPDSSACVTLPAALGMPCDDGDPATCGDECGEAGCAGLEPDCEGKECGSDGCGGSCGTCKEGGKCTNGGCVCAPQCKGKDCGPTTCGTCGTCANSGACVNGTCMVAKTAGSCKGMCGKQAQDCWCDLQCIGFGDCCADVCTHCPSNDYCCKPDCPLDDGCGGSDGCGGTCACPDSYYCTPEGFCCQPDCEGKLCSEPDGCGGQCGCPLGHMCNENSVCVCVPDCEVKECGSDGCGGSCGTCDLGEICAPMGGCAQAIDNKCQPNECGGQGGGCWCDEGCAPFGACCSNICDACPGLNACCKPSR